MWIQLCTLCIQCPKKCSQIGSHHFAAVPRWPGYQRSSGDKALVSHQVIPILLARACLQTSPTFLKLWRFCWIHPRFTQHGPTRYHHLVGMAPSSLVFEDQSWSLILGRYALRSLSELWIWLLSSMQSALGSVWPSSQWFAFTWLQKQPETNILYKCEAMVKIQNATYTDAFWTYWPKHLILDV